MLPRTTAVMGNHTGALEPGQSNQLGSAYATKGPSDHGHHEDWPPRRPKLIIFVSILNIGLLAAEAKISQNKTTSNEANNSNTNTDQ